MSDDTAIHAHIERLVSEEHTLWQREEEGVGNEDDRERLGQLKLSLDQCWDLLRQRRALREAGMNLEQARLRPPEVVERYEH